MTESDVERIVAERMSSLEQRLMTRQDQQIQQAFSGFTIQAGANINISGTGKNITISADVAQSIQLTAICQADGTILITASTS